LSTKPTMKKSVFLAAASFLTIVTSQAQIAKWTFETSGAAYNSAVTATSITGIAPEVGAGTFGGVHAAAAAWSSPVGNGTAESLSVNTWAVGDYWQFQVSTIGFTGIGLSYDQTSSGTGPRDFSLQYSTDGNNFTTFNSYTVQPNTAPNAWNATTTVASSSYTVDLSGVSALDNAPTVYFRLVNMSTVSANGGTLAAGGTDRLDNFTVIPEPGTLAILAIGATAMILRRRA